MSRRPKVTILYEDARGPRTEFGLHRLVLAAVRDCDAITALPHEVASALEHRCQKGIEQVLRTCSESLADLACDGRKVAVVVDEDVIRDKLKLPPGTALQAVKENILTRCPEQVRPQVAVFVLSRNTESVLKAAQTCVQEHRAETPSAEQFERALRKDLLARDQVLSGVAKETHVKVRRCIEVKVPALGELVAWLTLTLTAHA
ncbi:MAG: hypothetical protein KA244_10210 [Deltaproteobacteria bacterium]|nr:hypothetical protein [Deltaproteobacteria bacterium]